MVQKTSNTNTDTSKPVGSPNQHLFRNRKTGKIWEVGQELDCLSYELTITRGEAEALLAEGHGKDVRSILSLLGTKEIWKKICGAQDRVAYMCGVVRNQLAKSKANNPTADTSKPLPPSAAPLPMEKQAELWCDEDSDTSVPKIEPGGDFGESDDDDEAAAKATSMPAIEPTAAPQLADDIEVPVTPAPAESMSKPLPISAIETAEPVEDPAIVAAAARAAVEEILKTRPREPETWKEIVWCISQGITDMRVMADAIMVPVNVIERNRRLAATKGALVWRMEGSKTIYTISPGWSVADMKPSTASTASTASAKPAPVPQASLESLEQAEQSARAKILEVLSHGGWVRRPALFDAVFAGKYSAEKQQAAISAIKYLVSTMRVIVDDARTPNYRLAENGKEVFA